MAAEYAPKPTAQPQDAALDRPVGPTLDARSGSNDDEPLVPSPRLRVARSTLAVVMALALVGASYLVWARVTAPPGGVAWGPMDSILNASAQGRISRPAPDFVLPTADGGTLALADLRGQVVLLNFWATWCEPCRAEMADLDAFAREFGPRGFTVVGVNLLESMDAVKRFDAEMKLGFPLVADPAGEVYQAYGVMGLPTSYLLDADGVIRDVHLGVVTRAYLTARLSRLQAARS